MRALTLVRPWDYAIVHLGKLVENRTWRPPAALVGQRFAIHAGKGWDEDGVGFLRGAAGLSARELSAHLDRARSVAGAITATVRLARWFEVSEDSADELACSPWCFGPVAWVLDELHVLPVPVPCRGYQGLWPVPHAIEAAVRAQEPVS